MKGQEYVDGLRKAFDIVCDEPSTCFLEAEFKARVLETIGNIMKQEESNLPSTHPQDEDDYFSGWDETGQEKLT
mgnify:CR=1 FL=1